MDYLNDCGFCHKCNVKGNKLDNWTFFSFWIIIISGHQEVSKLLTVILFKDIGIQAYTDTKLWNRMVGGHTLHCGPACRRIVIVFRHFLKDDKKLQEFQRDQF